MSGVSAGRHVAPPRRWLPYALTFAVLAALLAGALAVNGRRATTDGPPLAPAEVDDRDAGNVDRSADAPGLVPEVREHIDGLRPRGRDPADALRRRLDAAAPPADGTSTNP